MAVLLMLGAWLGGGAALYSRTKVISLRWSVFKMLDIVGVPELTGTDEPEPPGLLGLRFSCISITPSIRSWKNSDALLSFALPARIEQRASALPF